MAWQEARLNRTKLNEANISRDCSWRQSKTQASLGHVAFATKHRHQKRSQAERRVSIESEAWPSGSFDIILGPAA